MLNIFKYWFWYLLQVLCTLLYIWELIVCIEYYACILYCFHGSQQQVIFSCLLLSSQDRIWPDIYAQFSCYVPSLLLLFHSVSQLYTPGIYLLLTLLTVATPFLPSPCFQTSYVYWRHSISRIWKDIWLFTLNNVCLQFVPYIYYILCVYLCIHGCISQLWILCIFSHGKYKIPFVFCNVSSLYISV